MEIREARRVDAPNLAAIGPIPSQQPDKIDSDVLLCLTSQVFVQFHMFCWLELQTLLVMQLLVCEEFVVQIHLPTLLNFAPKT